MIDYDYSATLRGAWECKPGIYYRMDVVFGYSKRDGLAVAFETPTPKGINIQWLLDREKVRDVLDGLDFVRLGDITISRQAESGITFRFVGDGEDIKVMFRHRDLDDAMGKTVKLVPYGYELPMSVIDEGLRGLFGVGS